MCRERYSQSLLVGLQTFPPALGINMEKSQNAKIRSNRPPNNTNPWHMNKGLDALSDIEYSNIFTVALIPKLSNGNNTNSV